MRNVVHIMGKRHYAMQFNAASSQYLTRTEANYRSGDTSGEVDIVMKTSAHGGATAGILFSSSDTSVNTRYFAIYIMNGLVHFTARQTGDFIIRGDTTNVSDGAYHAIKIISNGSACSIIIDGVTQSLTTITGSNTGQWFSTVTGRDNIVIAAITRLATASYFTGVIDYVNVYNGGALVSRWDADSPGDDMTGATGIIRDRIGALHLTPQNTVSGDKIPAF